MTNLLFPLVSLPQETTPDISARIASSFGFLASNKSATLGKPPVISLVLDDSLGIRAMTSPTLIFELFVKPRIELPSREYTAACLPPGKETSFPFSSKILTDGLSSLPDEDLSETSKTCVLLNPVKSSCMVLTVMPSSISDNLTLPSTSEIIGLVCGSQDAMISPALAWSPSLTEIIAP